MQFHYELVDNGDSWIGNVMEIALVVEGKNEKEVENKIKLGIEGYFQAFPEELQTLKPVKEIEVAV